MARFIAMLDILGFTKLVEDRGIDEIHQVINELFRSVQKGTKLDFSAKVDGRLYKHPAIRLNYFIFSDTIVIWKDYEKISKKNKNVVGNCALFNEFNMGVIEVLRNALRKSIPLRGGMAFGESIIKIDKSKHNNNEIIGQSIIDAHLVGESQNWIGVAFHSSCLDFISHCDSRVIKYEKLPFHKGRLSKIKKGHAAKFSLKWGYEPELEVLNDLKKDLIKSDSDEDVIEKYNNSIEFLEYVVKKDE